MELTPDFSILINDSEDIPKERITSIKTHDEAGIISDSCEFEFDDFDDALSFPNTEAKVEVFLGYKETGLTKIGTYFVKEIFVDGARRSVRIKANAASKAMRSQKTKTNEGSLGEFLQASSEELEFNSAIADNFFEVDLSDTPQFAESDISYLTRISQKIGAVVKPSDGHLIMADDASGKSISGQQLPTKYIDATDVASYSCSFKETESGGGSGTVYANWYDKNSGEYHLVHIGSGDPETELNEIFKDEKSALAACQAKFKRVSKSNITFSFSCAGCPDLFAESPLVLQGFGQKIPTNWIISGVEHSLSSNGFVTSIDCVGGN